MARCTVMCCACRGEFDLDGRYDDDVNQVEKCPHCGWIGSRFIFDYVSGDYSVAEETDDGEN